MSGSRAVFSLVSAGLFALLAITGPVQADTIGQGSVSVTFDASTTPSLTQYMYRPSNQYAMVRYYDPVTWTWTYPSGGDWGPFGKAYLDHAPYADGLGNTVDGAWDSGTGDVEFEGKAVSPNPGVLQGHVSVDMGTTYSFYGAIGGANTFPAFSYEYALEGQAGDPGSLSFAVQFAVRYWSKAAYEAGQYAFGIAYTNYDSSHPTYEAPPLFSTSDGGMIDESAVVEIGPLSAPLDTSLGGYWIVEYQTSMRAMDFAGSDTVIPEPGSVLLFAAGAIALAALRRRRH